MTAANLAAMSQMSPASFSNLDLGEGAVLHDNPLGGTWHNNPLVGSVMSTPRDSPRPPRLLLPGEATTEVVPVPLVRILQSGSICVVPMLYSSSQTPPSSPPRAQAIPHAPGWAGGSISETTMYCELQSSASL